jgi:hypothetical protein
MVEGSRGGRTVAMEMMKAALAEQVLMSWSWARIFLTLATGRTDWPVTSLRGGMAVVLYGILGVMDWMGQQEALEW